MAAFRKLVLGMAAATTFAVVASAQTAPALQCVANAGVPPTIRAEGLTELVGDVTLNCTGGIPTQLNAVVPASNVTVFLNTYITSRIVSTSNNTNWSEAILMIDEPHSTANPLVPLLACGDAATNEVANNPGVCIVHGTGTGAGVYSGTPGSIGGGVDTNGYDFNARPNVFQARGGVGAAGSTSNALTWSGVPFDAPGTSGTRVIRITNVRANANNLGTSSTLVPTSIVMYISVTGSNQLPINNPTQTVAFIQKGLVTQVTPALTYQQCASNNAGVASGTNFSGAIADFGVTLSEGFQSAFKRKNWGTDMSASGVPNPTGITYPANGDLNQNVPGAVYNTESGFENIGSAADPTPNPPAQLVNLGGSTVAGTAAFPTKYGLNNAGIANSGTRLELNFTGVVPGTTIFVPTVLPLVSQLSGAVTGIAVLTATDSGAFSPVSAAGNTGTWTIAPVATFNNAGQAVYEVLYSDPFNPEVLTVPVFVAYINNQANNLPAPGVTTFVSGQFAPQNADTLGGAFASAVDPIPRFAPSNAPTKLYSVVKCSCNLLFPFVTNQLGYDTGISIANTSLDPFGTQGQSGTVTLNYYCGLVGCTSPPAQTTNANVAAGQQVAFTLSGGGQYGLQATPGFQGYIIAQAQFQFCHAYAFLSAQGALPTSAGANTGYIALEMDQSFGSRTGNLSEVLGH